MKILFSIFLLTSLFSAVELRNKYQDKINELLFKYVPTNDIKGLESNENFKLIKQRFLKHLLYKVDLSASVKKILSDNNCVIIAKEDENEVKLPINAVELDANKFTEEALTEKINKTEALIRKYTHQFRFSMKSLKSDKMFGITLINQLNACMVRGMENTILVSKRVLIIFKQELSMIYSYADIKALLRAYINLLELDYC